MGRYGFLPQETEEAAALLQALPALRVEGVFTHLSDAANAKCTALQYRRFTEGVRILQEAGIDPGLRHVCASTAFLRYPEMHLDAVRLGSALLGRLSVPDTLGLEKIGWLETRVAELKTLPAGWSVGYTGAYRTKRETRLALLPVGYTSGIGVTEEPNALRLRDRLRRVLHAGHRLLHTDGLTVQINGHCCPVRGVVAAAQLEADVTELPCAVGDTVRVDDVQGDVVFRLVVCRRGRMVSLGVPFLLEKYTGAVRFFRAGEERQEAVLLQKFKEDFQAHMVGGVFEASDHPDFRRPDTLFAIKERPPRLRNVVCLPDKGKAYRYVRYYGPRTRHCNVSELAFYASAADTAALRAYRQVGLYAAQPGQLHPHRRPL